MWTFWAQSGTATVFVVLLFLTSGELTCLILSANVTISKLHKCVGYLTEQHLQIYNTKRERERERERERDKERQRETDRQTDRQTERETARETTRDRETDRDRDAHHLW